MQTIPEIFTIGHSTRTLDEFIQILLAEGVQHIVDVRTVPRSRRYPHFNRENLPASLIEHGIAYTHLPELGGFRKPKPDSLNTGWRNESFRGYADYMQTADFEEAVENLLDLAHDSRIALMCAEAVPWRCHRSLIADALLVRGREVRNITSANKNQLHKLTSFAQVEGARILYPPEEGRPNNE
jgi:uncharacterized protein (DUF488 family)